MNAAAASTNFTDHWGNFNINNDDGSPKYSTYKEFKTFAGNFKANWSNGKVSIYDCANSNKTFPSFYINLYVNGAGYMYLRLRVKSTTRTGGKTITASQPTRLMGEWSVKIKYSYILIEEFQPKLELFSFLLLHAKFASHITGYIQ